MHNWSEETINDTLKTWQPEYDSMGVKLTRKDAVEILDNLTSFVELCGEMYQGYRKKVEPLYDEIHACHICPAMDKVKAKRVFRAVNFISDVFVVAQSLAKGTVRESGINFFKTDGSPGSSGANFEKFLNKFQRTIYPPQSYCHEHNIQRPPHVKDFTIVYTSDIALCYPGRRNGNDRQPTRQEIKTCLSQGFLERELKIVKPKLVLLMGKHSRDSFYKYYLKYENYPRLLSDHIDQIVKSKKLSTFELDGRKISILPIQHSSGANPKFNNMLDNQALIKLIQSALGSHK